MAEAAELLAIVLPVLVGVVLIGIANLVARSGREHRHNLFFAALYFLSGMKSISEGLAGAADQFHAEAPFFPPRLFWELLGTFCALGMMPLLLLFVSSFPRPVAWMVKAPGRGAWAFVPSVVVAASLVLAVTGRGSASLYLDLASLFNILFTAVTVIAIVLLARTRARSPDAIERTQAFYVLLGFMPAFVMGWAISGLQIGDEAGLVPHAQADSVIQGILHFVSPLLELVAGCLVGFAILKYNILGIHPKFRLGVKSVAAGLMFVGLFVLTQFVENVVLQGKVFAFAGRYGSFLLSGSVGLVLFKPIGKVSNKVSDRLLPGSAPPQPADGSGAPTAASLHAEQIYHAQATYVLRDAHVSERELAFLANLRTQLGLSEAQARRIEEEVERLLKVDAPQTGHSGAPTPQEQPGAAAPTGPAGPLTAPASGPASPPPEGPT